MSALDLIEDFLYIFLIFAIAWKTGFAKYVFSGKWKEIPKYDREIPPPWRGDNVE